MSFISHTTISCLVECQFHMCDISSSIITASRRATSSEIYFFPIFYYFLPSSLIAFTASLMSLLPPSLSFALRYIASQRTDSKNTYSRRLKDFNFFSSPLAGLCCCCIVEKKVYAQINTYFHRLSVYRERFFFSSSPSSTEAPSILLPSSSTPSSFASSIHQLDEH